VPSGKLHSLTWPRAPKTHQSRNHTHQSRPRGVVRLDLVRVVAYLVRDLDSLRVRPFPGVPSEENAMTSTTHPSELPVALDLPDAAQLIGISRTAAYELVRTGQWPSPVLRLGHRIKIPTQPLLELLGLSTGQRSEPAPVPRAEAG
jgi:hypothetical protein